MTSPIDQSQPRLQLLIEQSPLAIIEWNTKFEVSMVMDISDRLQAEALVEEKNQALAMALQDL
jgi:hypothetical protein